jgi:hypothetical protein
MEDVSWPLRRHVPGHLAHNRRLAACRTCYIHRPTTVLRGASSGSRLAFVDTIAGDLDAKSAVAHQRDKCM